VCIILSMIIYWTLCKTDEIKFEYATKEERDLMKQKVHFCESENLTCVQQRCQSPSHEEYKFTDKVTQQTYTGLVTSWLHAHGEDMMHWPLDHIF
jgi:hypothetical protein